MNKKTMKMTTAQFAQIHHIHRRTLHYYDEIGLFSPLEKGENGYRYYDYSQSMKLEYILMLKELNLSLDEIKAYQKHPNSEQFIALANQKEAELDAMIKKLKQTQQILQKKKEQLLLCKSIRHGDIQFLKQDQRYFLTIPYDFAEDDVKKAFDLIQKNWDASLYRRGFGSFLSVEKVLKQDFSAMDGLFAELPKEERKKASLICPAGVYCCGYCVGSWDQLPFVYSKMMNEVIKKGYQLTGFAMEMGLNEFAIDSMAEYVTQILIPIVKKAD